MRPVLPDYLTDYFMLYKCVKYQFYTNLMACNRCVQSNESGTANVYECVNLNGRMIFK